MTIEVKDVTRIDLKENELLFITIPGLAVDVAEEMFCEIEDAVPENWKKRIFIINADAEFKKVTKED
jgi:hypothetical protein